MLNGGEKSKIKRMIVAINGEYPKVLDILDNQNLLKNQQLISELYAINKKIFMWLAHLTTTLINSNEVLYKSFDIMQEANRKSSVSVKDVKQVKLLMNSVETIPNIQNELISLIDSDNGMRDRVLRDIMDELGIEDPRKKEKKSNKKFSSMSFDDWFNDD